MSYGGLIAAAVGVAGGALAALWLAKKAKETGHWDACTNGCTAVASAYGYAGQHDSCQQACDQAAPVMKDVVNAVSDFNSKLTGLITGWGDRPKLECDKCPKDTECRGAFGGFADASGLTVSDHRGFTGDQDKQGLRGSQMVCVNKDGNIVGTILPDGFHSFEGASQFAKQTAPIIPVRDPTLAEADQAIFHGTGSALTGGLQSTTTATGGRGPYGGVSVTSSQGSTR